jgi:DNA repair exonuclease SbcCD nuclease subunit
LENFSFVHISDLHLGYLQYGLEVRRQDFDNVFVEVVDKILELKPDFMIVAGDFFHQPRPSNITLENTVRSLKRLRDAGIPVLTVDGSHDSAPNMITGTILHPLDSAGLVYHLPRHEGACWRKPGCCYVYGVPNYRNRQRVLEAMPLFMKQNVPAPDPSLFNVFVFHMAVELEGVIPSYMEAEVPPELIPDGFNYYAGGHIHERYMGRFKSGYLVYSGCTETVSFDEAAYRKGFYHVKVDDGVFNADFVELESPRKFIVLEHDFSGVDASRITDCAVQLVKSADDNGVVIVPVLKGTLPVEAKRSEIDLAKIKNAAEKALIVHPIVSMRESTVSESVVRSIFESELKDLKTKAFEYFLQVFSERYSREEAERIASMAITLVEPLTRKQGEKVMQVLEEMLK